MKNMILIAIFLTCFLIQNTNALADVDLRYISLGLTTSVSLQSHSYEMTKLGSYNYFGFGYYFQAGKCSEFDHFAWNLFFNLNIVTLYPVIKETKITAYQINMNIDFKYCFNSRRHISPYVGLGLGIPGVIVEYNPPVRDDEGYDNEVTNRGFAINLLGGVYIPITTKSFDLDIGFHSPIVIFSTPNTFFNYLIFNAGIGLKF